MLKRRRTGFISLLLLALGVALALGFSAPTRIAAAPDAAGISIQPGSLVVFAGQVFTVSLSITGASNAGGYEATLFFNPALLQVQEVTHPVPGFLAFNGRSDGAPSGAPLINSAVGRITVAQYSYAAGNPAGAGGSGVLAHIRFKALAVGTSPLAFSTDPLYPLQLLDIQSNSLALTSLAGSVNIQPGKLFLPLIRR